MNIDKALKTNNPSDFYYIHKTIIHICFDTFQLWVNLTRKPFVQYDKGE